MKKLFKQIIERHTIPEAMKKLESQQDKDQWDKILMDKYRDNPVFDPEDYRHSINCIYCDLHLINGITFKFNYREPYPFDIPCKSPIYGRVNQECLYCPICGKKLIKL